MHASRQLAAGVYLWMRGNAPADESASSGFWQTTLFFLGLVL
jgi:hypothetical protein